VEQGSHGELMEMGGLYFRLYQRQFRDDRVTVEEAIG
jgi:ABC-type multidrug transport system fused ATPase/permease subunit